MRTRRNSRFVEQDRQNRNAVIRTREDRTGKTRTETYRRDDSTSSFAVSTDTKNDSTRLFIDLPGSGGVQLTGSEARTLYRLLKKHYSSTGKVY